MIETEKYIIYESWIDPAEGPIIIGGVPYESIIKKVERKKDNLIFSIGEIVVIITNEPWYPKQWKIIGFEIDTDDVKVWLLVTPNSHFCFPLSEIKKKFILNAFI